jgi:hypothetical protein
VRLARQRSREAHRRRMILTALVVAGPLIWLLWPVKSLFYHIPKWYVQLLLGL